MDKSDAFKISTNNSPYLYTIEQEKVVIDPPNQKIVKLSSECLKEENFLIKTKTTKMTLPLKKNLSLSLDFGTSYWNELKLLPDNTTKEQLHDLLLLCDIKSKSTKRNNTHVISFAFSLVNTEGIDLKKTRSTLGKLIYLVNCDSEKISEELRHKNEEKKIQHIENSFEIEMNNIASFLLNFQSDHKNGLLQDEHKALSVRIPIEVAKALISDTGYVNIGIIDILMSRFLSPKKILPFEQNIAFALNTLKRSSLLRQKIHFITGPYSQLLPANDLIRITLGLPSDAITTHIDAKKTALAALISHMRQSPASSCFASYLAIELLSKKLVNCLNDFCELLQKNSLTRHVNGNQKEFYFLMRTGKESTSQIIKLDKSGKIYTANNLVCYSWEVPGIKAACTSLGFADVRKTLQDLSLDITTASKNDLTKISISRILKLLAKKSKGDPSYNFHSAKLSFEGQLHNPLLRVWENVMASMSEATEHGKITEALVHSISIPLEKILTNHPVLKRSIIKKFIKHLLNAAHYAYDMDVKNSHLASDGRSGRGAFILYNKCGSGRPADWKLMENAEDFKAFIISLIYLCFSTIPNKDTMIGDIKKAVTSDKFLIDCLRNYNISNTSLSDNELLQNLKTLPHTPWKDRTGNNSIEVLRIYFDQKALSLPVTLRPKNATKLLTHFIEIGREFPESFKQVLSEKPNILTPLIIKDVHAFSMMFGSPSLMKAISSKLSVENWINDCVINPGLKISHEKISEEAKKTLILFVAHHAIPKSDKAGLEKFQEKIHALNGELTLTAFRNQLIGIIKEISNEYYQPLKALVQGVDFYIYKYGISEESKKILETAIIQFADSNWDAKLHDVHFCFFFNPGSAQLEMWEVYEDGTGLYPMTQQDWIQNQTWELYET